MKEKSFQSLSQCSKTLINLSNSKSSSSSSRRSSISINSSSSNSISNGSSYNSSRHGQKYQRTVDGSAATGIVALFLGGSYCSIKVLVCFLLSVLYGEQYLFKIAARYDWL